MIKCNIPELLIVFFNIAFFALDVFRLEKINRIFYKKFQIYPVKSKKRLFFQIFQPVAAGLLRNHPHCTAADDLLYKTLLKKQQFNDILSQFQKYWNFLLILHLIVP